MGLSSAFKGLICVFKNIGCKGVNCIHPAQDLNERSAVVGQIRGLRFPKKKF